jgi:MAF protein
MNLILASGSTYRQSLLRRLRLPFSWEAPQVDESPEDGEKPAAMAVRLARKKAAAIAARHPDALVIGSDQVASLDGRLLGKPGTGERALAQLSACSGRCVTFDTGLCLWPPEDAPRLTCVTTRVHFRELSQARLQRYVALDQPLDCAGSFKWESLGICLFRRLEGDDPTALEGLPLIALSGMLAELGVDPLGS